MSYPLRRKEKLGLSRWMERRQREGLPVVRGNMRRMIVVRPRDPMFTEALFILRDDYFQTPGMSRRQLLHQAQAAAQDQLREPSAAMPQKPGLSRLLPAFSLGAAAAILAMWLGGLI